MALAVFQLNGRFTAMLDQLTLPYGLSSARWQILSAVTAEPMSVSGIARGVGATRQSVQRIADLLVEQGLAVYRDNPAHRRAKLLTATEQGVAAAREIEAAHAEMARRLCDEVGAETLFLDAADLLRGIFGALRHIASEDGLPSPRVPAAPRS